MGTGRVVETDAMKDVERRDSSWIINQWLNSGRVKEQQKSSTSILSFREQMEKGSVNTTNLYKGPVLFRFYYHILPLSQVVTPVDSFVAMSLDVYSSNISPIWNHILGTTYIKSLSFYWWSLKEIGHVLETASTHPYFSYYTSVCAQVPGKPCFPDFDFTQTFSDWPSFPHTPGQLSFKKQLSSFLSSIILYHLSSFPLLPQ